jgi:sialic acid synthase SpsE
MKNKLLVIAEMACSHDGNIKIAKKIAKKSYEAGADVIQLQIWKLNDLISPDNPNYSRIAKAEISNKEWREIVNYIRKKIKKILIYICVYEHKSIDFVLSLKPDGIKINSSDLNNPLMLKKISKLKIPINLSVGSSTVEEINFALKFFKNKKNLNLMYGFQSFPTPIEAINIQNIKYLLKKYKLKIGYQDHSPGKDWSGFYLPAYAIGIGAQIIEKHITLNRKKCKFDFESALEPNEFSKFIQMTNDIKKISTTKNPLKLNKFDFTYRKFQKKSLVFSRDMKKGEKISKKDLSVLRIDREGISPRYISKIIGKKVLNNSKKFYSLDSNYLK